MKIDLQKLRETAKAIVRIPGHYRLEMENSIPKEEERERCYIWEDPDHAENSIEVALDLATGVLMRLSMDRAEAEERGGGEDTPEPEEAAVSGNKLDLARQAAEAFIERHHPAPSALTVVKAEARGNLYQFEYNREAHGLPLHYTGCVITLDSRFQVTWYRLRERPDFPPKLPEWPGKIVEEPVLLGQLQEQLRMKLVLVTLHSSLHEIGSGEPEIRLVYEPLMENRWIDAATGTDLFGPEHYAMPASRPLPPAAAASSPVEEEDLGAAGWARQLGIDPKIYRLEKTAEDEELETLLYTAHTPKEQDRDLVDPLSVDGYMERKWGDQLRFLMDSAIKIQWEKSTGRLVSYHHSGCKGGVAGEAALTREECWRIAERFLGKFFPEYAEYLQLEDRQDDEEEDERRREFFYLPVYVRGIPVSHERVMIAVYVSTGAVCLYAGVSYEMIQTMAALPLRPVLSQEEAAKRYAERMKLQLKWHLEKEEGKEPVFRLVYQPSVTAINASGVERRVWYIDAVTGEYILGT